MQISRRSRFVLVLSIALLFGCSTPSFFRIKNHDFNRVELNITPDRVIIECPVASKETGGHMFLIHVLDEEKTVTTVNQGNLIGNQDCEERLMKIGKILERGKKIYLAGMGSLVEPRQMKEYFYTFPAWGTFSGNGRGLQFMVIANDLGECYHAYHGDRKPCPRNEFPIDPAKGLF